MKTVPDALRELAESIEQDDGALGRTEPVDLRPGQEDMEFELSQGEFGFDVAVGEQLEKRGIYSAERLQVRKPELHKATCKLLRSGVSAGTIGELLSLDIRTVIAVSDKLEREGSITPYKEKTVWQLRAVVGVAIDQLLDQARRGLLKPLDVAILIDKIELLSGGVTSRTEVVESPEAVAARQRLERLRQMTSGMVLEGEVLVQRAPELPAPERDVFPVRVNSYLAADGCTRDTESSASDMQNVERQ